MADAPGRLAAALAEGTRAIAELSAIYDATADALYADLAVWRRSLAWDRQAPAPLFVAADQP